MDPIKRPLVATLEFDATFILLLLRWHFVSTKRKGEYPPLRPVVLTIITFVSKGRISMRLTS